MKVEKKTKPDFTYTHTHAQMWSSKAKGKR